MDDSRRSPPADRRRTPAVPIGARGLDAGVSDAIHASVAHSLAQALPQGGRIGVALSGGRDSVALFDAAVNVAANARCDVIALHVHHGLSANAGDWSTFCAELCTARAVAYATRDRKSVV